jgi:hypothetical protein
VLDATVVDVSADEVRYASIVSTLEFRLADPDEGEARCSMI